MKDKKAIFETINPYRAILALAIPTIISQLIDVFYNIADTVFIGRTGNPYMIASTGIAIGLFAIGIVISNLFGIGGGSLAARLLGIGKNDRLKYISSFSFYACIITSIIYSLLVFIFMKPVLYLMGASDATYEYCRQYTQIVVIFGVPIMTASNTIAHLLRNVGYSLHAGIGLSLGGVLNIILDPIFMFVLFKEGNEVIAAGYATLLSNVVALIYEVIVFLLTHKKTELSLNPRNALSIRKSNIASVFKIGVPSALLVFLFIISQMVMLSRMSVFGDLQVAAVGIIVKVEKVAGAIGLGFCQGMLPIVAYNYSAKNYDRMNATIKAGRLLGFAAAILCGIVIFFASKPISGLFLDADSQDAIDTINYSSQYLKIRFLVPVFMLFNYHSSYSMQALNDGKNTLIHATCRILVINIPLVFAMSAIWGHIGLALAFEVSEFLAAILGTYLLHLCKKKAIQTA